MPNVDGYLLPFDGQHLFRGGFQPLLSLTG
jgi:uncharacterized protein YbaA (DUF1428 family)